MKKDADIERLDVDMLIVDTNVIFPFFVQGKETKNAVALYEIDPIWATEPFAIVEFANILSTYFRSGLVDRRKALEYLELIYEYLAPNFISVPDSKALDMAMEYSITAYDARFLALAEITGQKLITEDIRLRRSAPTLTQSMEEALVAFP